MRAANPKTTGIKQDKTGCFDSNRRCVSDITMSVYTLQNLLNSDYCLLLAFYGHVNLLWSRPNSSSWTLLRQLDLMKKRWRKMNRRENYGRTSPYMAPACHSQRVWLPLRRPTSVWKGWVKARRHSWLHKNTRAFWASFYQTTRNDLRYSLSKDEVVHHWQLGVIWAGRCGKQVVPNPSSWYCTQAPVLYCKI